MPKLPEPPEGRKPVPGDVTTEPVATAAQSHVDGRVGPPTIAQDATSDYAPEGVAKIAPGEPAPADTPFVGGPLEPLAGETADPAAADVGDASSRK